MHIYQFVSCRDGLPKPPRPVDQQNIHADTAPGNAGNILEEDRKFRKKEKLPQESTSPTMRLVSQVAIEQEQERKSRKQASLERVSAKHKFKFLF